MTRLRLYRNDFESAVLALTVELGSRGKVTLKRGRDKAAADAAMQMVGDGLVVLGGERVVKPSDGEVYLDAFESMFASTSHWLLSREDD